MQQGAFTYLQKPLDLSHLRTAVDRASEGVRLKRQNLELHQRLVDELQVRTAAEEALAHEREHLAELVDARTHELTERNEQLAAASLAKGPFAPWRCNST